FFREMIAGRIPPPPITATLGFGWVSVEPGQVVFEITPAEYQYNPIGAVHSMLPAGAYYTSLDLSVRFIRQITARTGRMLCQGTVDHLGSRTALATARLTDAGGKLSAQAPSSCMIFRPGG